MEFFKGEYIEKKLGTHGLFDNQERFVMCTVNQIPSEHNIKIGMILDNYGLAQFNGRIDENEMHFVKVYTKYKESPIVYIPTIQYDLVKTDTGLYQGSYILGPTNPNRNPILSSGECTIKKIDDEGIVKKTIEDGLKYADEDLINFILKTIFKGRIPL